MKKNESGITLLSLVVTVVVMALLAAVLVDASINSSPALETINNIANEYYDEQTKTEDRIDDMTNGWENIIL